MAVICFIIVFSVIAGLNTTTNSTRATKADVVEEVEEIPSVWADEDTDIDDFDYYIDGSEIHLKGYNGRAKKVRIAPTYEIDGDLYNVVELNGTFALHSVDSVIVPEGVTKLSNNTFNSSGVEYVYLPSIYIFRIVIHHPFSSQNKSGERNSSKAIFSKTEYMLRRISGE